MSASKRRKDPTLRSTARLAAVQALYQMEVAGTDLHQVVREFEEHRLGAEIEGERYKKADELFFGEIVEGVVQAQRRIDPALNERLAEGWRLGRIDSILRAILRCAAYELIERRDVPARVILNEYIDISRAFFEGDEPKVVNAVLDSLARAERADEVRKAGA